MLNFVCCEIATFRHERVNVGFIVFTIGIFVNYIVLRKFEAQGSLDFLTDWLKRVPKKTNMQDGDAGEITAAGHLDNESRHKLTSGLHYKLILAKIMARTTSSAVQSFELIAFPVFIYKRKPSFFIICLGLWNCITMLVCVEIACYHLNFDNFTFSLFITIN